MPAEKSEASEIRDQQFIQWKTAFETKLKAEKPYGLTDKAIGEFSKYLESIYIQQKLPDHFKLDKMIGLVVREAAQACGLLVDDFPESGADHESLVDIAQEVRQGMPREPEDLTETRDLDPEFDLSEAKRTVLNYEIDPDNAPSEQKVNYPETAEHFEQLKRGRK